MSEVEQAAPFERQVQAVLQWLDGAGSEFLTRIGIRSGRRHIWEFECPHPALQGYTRVKLILPRGFPAATPRIMVDKALCLLLPHVEGPGLVCLGSSVANAYAEPVHAVLDVLNAFRKFLDRCSNIAWVTREFEREALAYWGRFCAGGENPSMRRRVDHLYNALGRVHSVVDGQVASYQKGRVALATGPKIDPNFLAQRHNLAYGTMELGRALFVPLPASACWTPRSWPRTFRELTQLVRQASDGAFHLGEWWAANPSAPRARYVILTAENAAYAYQLMEPVVRNGDGPKIVPREVTRIDPDWALVRDQRLERIEKRRTKRILVLGCGSLGAPLAILLAKSGVQNLTLVDKDIVMPENVSRHPLGMRAVLRPKATELAAQLNADLPGVVVKGYGATAADWILDKCRSGAFDLVIDCTGEESVRRFLSEVRESIFPETPIVHAWMEPFCAASHTVLIDTDTVWPVDDPVLQIHVAEWQDDTEIVLPACNSGFHEYGPADVSQAAAVASKCVLRVIDDEAGMRSKVWSTVRSTAFFESLGVRVMPGPLVPQSDDSFHSVRLTRELADVFTAQSWQSC